MRTGIDFMLFIPVSLGPIKGPKKELLFIELYDHIL